MKYKTLSVKKELHDELKKLSNAKNKPMSKIIRELLNKEEKNSFENVFIFFTVKNNEFRICERDLKLNFIKLEDDSYRWKEIISNSIKEKLTYILENNDLVSQFEDKGNIFLKVPYFNLLDGITSNKAKMYKVLEFNNKIKGNKSIDDKEIGDLLERFQIKDRECHYKITTDEILELIKKFKEDNHSLSTFELRGLSSVYSLDTSLNEKELIKILTSKISF